MCVREGHTERVHMCEGGVLVVLVCVGVCWYVSGKIVVYRGWTGNRSEDCLGSVVEGIHRRSHSIISHCLA